MTCGAIVVLAGGSGVCAHVCLCMWEWVHVCGCIYVPGCACMFSSVLDG